MNISMNGPLSYPSTDGITKNPRLASALVNSRMNELNSISDYVYFNIILQKEHPSLAELFEHIAMTEMIHFRILGKMIMSLGGSPAIRTNVVNCNISLPPSKCDIKRLITSSIASERRAKSDYERLAREAGCDKNAAMLLCRIALDEENHAKLLASALQNFQIQ